MGIMSHRTGWRVTLLSAAIVLVTTSGCDMLSGLGGSKSDRAPSKEKTAAPAKQEDSEPATERAVAETEKNFGGTWATAWGPVTLSQDGTKVSGGYSGQFRGGLNGDVDGNVATVVWTQTNGENGRAKFTLSEDGDRFTGTWGSGASSNNGGAWNGKRTN